MKNISIADGLILAGGGNIFNYEKTLSNKIRDAYEKKLFNYFFKKNKPILLICRGFQLLTSLYKRKLFKVDNNHPFSLIGFEKKAALAIQNHFRLSNYQMLVLSWIKGLWTGILLSLVIHFFVSH